MRQAPVAIDSPTASSPYFNSSTYWSVSGLGASSFFAADCAGALTPHPSETGMQLWAEYRGDDLRLRAEAAARGVETGAVSHYYFARPQRGGLVLGFGCVRPQQIRPATQKLAQALEALGRG